ncbi:uncharacterized protein LOC119098269 [Pollicipes pollicipes]|uniref:uncharacterized protein LOC119098269 n=1 Tax=Pollicipes pollicipes TaxID=41117 RepID=UPI00188576E2|nr:uncharacterized protein LOC119098269 [Pollicipes pollicipes]
MLDTTREHLVWPGTPVGGSGVRPLFIKNTSATESMNLALDIADGTFFKFETVPKPSSSFEIAMAPRTERNVNVLFTPNEVHTYRDSVVIRPSTQHRSLNSAMIPLSGYAGLC